MKAEDIERIAGALPLAEIVKKDPVSLELYGTTTWLVDVEAAHRAFFRRGVPESHWGALMIALEARVDDANDRERGVR